MTDKNFEHSNFGITLASAMLKARPYVQIKLKKCRENARVPKYKTEGSAGMDICAAILEPVTLKPMERKLIPTGLQIELPIDVEAQIRPRSGLSIKYGITLVNCVGTIDSDYRGEICVPLINLSQEDYTIQPDERIAQMIIIRYTLANFIEVAKLSETSRGEKGFGSTGRI